MARKPNYRFEKSERERKKAAKKAAKQEAKQAGKQPSAEGEEHQPASEPRGLPGTD